MGRRTSVDYEKTEVAALVRDYEDGKLTTLEALRNAIRQVTGVQLSTMSVWRHLSKMKAITAPKRDFSNPCVLNVFSRYKKDLLSVEDVKMELEVLFGWKVKLPTVWRHLKAYEEDQAILKAMKRQYQTIGDEFSMDKFVGRKREIASDGDGCDSDSSSSPPLKLFRRNSLPIKRLPNRAGTSEESSSYMSGQPIFASVVANAESEKVNPIEGEQQNLGKEPTIEVGWRVGQTPKLEPEPEAGVQSEEPELEVVSGTPSSRKRKHSCCECKQFYEAIVELHNDIFRCVHEIKEMRNEMRQMFADRRVAENQH